MAKSGDLRPFLFQGSKNSDFALEGILFTHHSDPDVTSGEESPNHWHFALYKGRARHRYAQALRVGILRRGNFPVPPQYHVGCMAGMRDRAGRASHFEGQGRKDKTTLGPSIIGGTCFKSDRERVKRVWRPCF